MASNPSNINYNNFHNNNINNNTNNNNMNHHSNNSFTPEVVVSSVAATEADENVYDGVGIEVADVARPPGPHSVAASLPPPSSSDAPGVEHYRGRRQQRPPPRYPGYGGEAAPPGTDRRRSRRDAGEWRGYDSHPPPRPSRGARMESYAVSPTAPRLYVPNNLPVHVTSLIDFTASIVCKAGPTVEDELIKREEDNPDFRFLLFSPDATAPGRCSWKSPEAIYYRWRVYSLLNGDTLTQWRTEPFQIELHPSAYVFIPPPSLECGVNSLNFIFKNRADTQQPFAAPPPPSELWASRVTASTSGHVFHCCSPAEREEWQRLLDPAQVDGEGDSRLLRREVIGRRMVFVLDHAMKSQHLFCMLMDKVVAMAAVAAQRLGAKHRAGASEAAAVTAQCRELLWYLFIVHDVAVNCCARPANTTTTAVSVGVADKASPAPVAVAAPFPPTAEYMEGLRGVHEGRAEAGVVMPGPLPPHAAPALGEGVQKDIILQSLESVLPTLTEAFLIVVLSNMQYLAPGDASRLAPAPCGDDHEIVLSNLQDEFSAIQNSAARFETAVPAGTATASASHSGIGGSEEGTAAAAAVAEAFQLSMVCHGWLKALVAYWGDLPALFADGKRHTYDGGDAQDGEGAEVPQSRAAFEQSIHRSVLHGRFGSSFTSKYPF